MTTETPAADFAPPPAADRRWSWIAFALLGAFLLAVYHGGEDTVVRVHDNLDINVAWYKVLTETGQWFAPLGARVDRLAGGLPRNHLPSELVFGNALFAALPPFWAMAMNDALLRMIALIGMALLLRRFLTPDAPPWMIWGVALLYALLPYFFYIYATIAGYPLALWAFLSLRNRPDRWRYAAILFVYPFYSDLVHGGFALYVLLAGILAHDLLRRRAGWRTLFLALLGMSLLNLVAEYRLVYAVLLGYGPPIHRVEFANEAYAPLAVILRHALRLFVHGHYHAASLQYPVHLLVAVLATFLIWKPLTTRRAAWLLVLLLLAATGLCLLVPSAAPVLGAMTLVSLLLLAWTGKGHPYARGMAVTFLACAALSVPLALKYLPWKPLADLADTPGLPWLRGFQFNRLFFLLPLLWTGGLALGLEALRRRSAHATPLLATILVLLLGLFAWREPSLKHQAYALGDRLPFLRDRMPERRLPTYRRFYADGLFARVRMFLQTRDDAPGVVSLGLHPAIAQYNGLRTLDGYFVLYPLAYKKRFRKVIAPELAKNDAMRRYYDQWGNRVYLWCDELWDRREEMKYGTRLFAVSHLALDTKALRKLGGRYIIAAYPIENASSLGLRRLHVFEDDGSPWTIHLYEVIATPEEAPDHADPRP